MLRFLLILIAIVVLLRLMGWTPPRLRAPPKGDSSPAPGTGTTDLVACARCGVHLPRNLALERDSHWYCSVQHRDS